MKIKDERIVSAKRRVFNEAYFLVIGLTALSLVTKYYLLQLPVNDYVTELVLIVGSIACIVIRKMTLGLEIINSDHQAKYWWGLATIGLSLLATIIAGFQNYQQYQAKYQGIFDQHFLLALGLLFVSSLLLMSAIIGVFYWFNHHGQRALEHRINR